MVDRKGEKGRGVEGDNPVTVHSKRLFEPLKRIISHESR